MPFLSRRKPQPVGGARAGTAIPQSGRSLTASAQQVVIRNRDQARQLTAARQAWQYDAWSYRRNLGELRYASAYLGNSCMRLRMHIATYKEGESEPLELTRANCAEHGIPVDLYDAAKDALNRLGAGGPFAQQVIQKKMAENFEIAGECYLIGETDPLTREEDWQIRSISEVVVHRDGRVGLREMPNASSGNEVGVRWLNENNTLVLRLWWPDPEFAMLADSPVKAILDICEELLLLGQDVRATARSRLANNGMLLLPDSLTARSATTPDNEDPNIDPVLQHLIDAATASLTNEGSASAVVPIIIRGPSEAINAVKHLPLARPANVQNIAQRQELITRMATGIDLPSEVLTGKADLNHWSAWQVDDDSFRHHIEPLAIVQVDALTAGYLWTVLDTIGAWPRDLIRRMVFWYDPTALVTHPDQSKDALQAETAGAIGRKGLRHYLGISDEYAPDELDEVLYVLEHARGVDPKILVSILKTITKTIQLPSENDLGNSPGAQPAPGPTADLPAPADGTEDQPGPPPAGPAAPAPADGTPPAPAGATAAPQEFALTASQVALAEYVVDRVLAGV